MQGEMAAQDQKDLLLHYTDQLRLSMAANLRDYQLESFKASARCSGATTCPRLAKKIQEKT